MFGACESGDKHHNFISVPMPNKNVGGRGTVKGSMQGDIIDTTIPSHVQGEKMHRIYILGSCPDTNMYIIKWQTLRITTWCPLAYQNCST